MDTLRLTGPGTEWGHLSALILVEGKLVRFVPFSVAKWESLSKRCHMGSYLTPELF